MEFAICQEIFYMKGIFERRLSIDSLIKEYSVTISFMARYSACCVEEMACSLCMIYTSIK